MLKKLSRLGKPSLDEWLLLLHLSVVALTMRVGLWCVPVARLVRFLSQCAENRWLRQVPLRHGRHDMMRLAALADMAAMVTLGQGRCLIRSLLLFWLLRAREEPAELVIGINKEASTLNSHAWIETQGRVIGDSAIVRDFATVVRF